MVAKLNLWERKDGKPWEDYITGEISKRGIFYEIRFGNKYYNNPDYKPNELVEVTVGKDPATAPTVLTLTLIEKELKCLKDISQEFINERWNNCTLEKIVEDLTSVYGKDKVTMDSIITILKFK